MLIRIVAASLAMASLLGITGESFVMAADYPTFGRVERVDPRIDKLIAPDAELEKLAEGFRWTEGPVWVPEGEYLLFSDIPNNVVVKWKAGEGTSEYLKPAGYTGAVQRGGEPGSNGLVLDSQGRLILCEHGDRRIARLLDGGEKETLADKYDGQRFNSPNDLVYKSNGDLYFTDPPYGLTEGPEDPAREMDYCGVFRLSTDGTVTLLTKALKRPNGLAFSPDEKTLYVAQSDPQAAIWMAYEVQEDGTLDEGRVFYDATKWVGERPGLPDGLKVDVHGNLFATGPGGVLIFTPEGDYLGRIDTGVPTSNCAFGDDGQTLYITANNAVARIPLLTRGVVQPTAEK